MNIKCPVCLLHCEKISSPNEIYFRCSNPACGTTKFYFNKNNNIIRLRKYDLFHKKLIDIVANKKYVLNTQGFLIDPNNNSEENYFKISKFLRPSNLSLNEFFALIQRAINLMNFS